MQLKSRHCRSKLESLIFARAGQTLPNVQLAPTVNQTHEPETKQENPAWFRDAAGFIVHTNQPNLRNCNI
jgi:hypothetical protein